MKNFVYTILFLAVLVGAAFVVDNTSRKVDMPFEAGELQAPDIDRSHGAAEGSGHGEATESGSHG